MTKQKDGRFRPSSCEFLQVLGIASSGSRAGSAYHGVGKDISFLSYMGIPIVDEALERQFGERAHAIGCAHINASEIPISARTGQGYIAIGTHRNSLVGIGNCVHTVESNIAFRKHSQTDIAIVNKLSI